jgi:hypothetical protein
MSDENVKGHRETFLDDKKSSTEAGDPERQYSHSEMEKGSRNDISEDLKLDSTGLPLVPQPSRFKDDPLVSNLSVVTASNYFYTILYPKVKTAPATKIDKPSFCERATNRPTNRTGPHG